MQNMKFKYVIISALLSVALFFSISAKSSIGKAGNHDLGDCLNCSLDDCF